MTTGKPEREIQREIQLALASVPGLRLFRANVGRGWVSETKPLVSREAGKQTVTLFGARPFDTGLPEGFPDLFGFIEERTGVTPVFIEVKSERGKVSEKQHAFIRAAKHAGCRAGIARSVEEALAIVRGET
jgi:hypothetical protein